MKYRPCTYIYTDVQYVRTFTFTCTCTYACICTCTCNGFYVYYYMIILILSNLILHDDFTSVVANDDVSLLVSFLKFILINFIYLFFSLGV